MKGLQGLQDDLQSKHFGSRGSILRVNLTHNTVQIEELPPSFYKRYMGGRNIALYFLLRELEPGVDPLSPANKLVFTTSVLTGSALPGSSRHTIAAKSPMTGGFGESEAGGWWGAELKFAGFDAIIVEGRAARPVFLWIHDKEVSILDATNLWGKSTGEAEEAIKSELGDSKIRVLQIGPAGERLVRFAAVVNELRHFNGRTGMGAVMGSKNLRAIAVYASTRTIDMANPEKVREFITRFSRWVPEHPALKIHRELGTPKGVLPLNAAGLLPTHNFREGSFAGAEDISGERMLKTIHAGRHTCYGCPVTCKRVVKGDLETHKYEIDSRYGGPEYETIGAFGSICGVSDLPAVAKANELCNAYGMDTISTGLTIAFAMECYERGILTQKETGGLKLEFGNGGSMVETVRLIGERQGLGDLLAEGSKRAAERIGRGSERYAMHVKGLEFPSHEPRGKWGVALGYAVSPTGADHLQAAHDPFFERPGSYVSDAGWVDLEDLSPLGVLDPVPAESLAAAKVRLFVYLQYIWSLHNVLDFCIFTTVPEFRALGINQMNEMVQAVTGWRTSVFELAKAGERGVTMARAFNVREGFGRADDRLPERLFEPLAAGPLTGSAVDRHALEEAILLYYGMMGWDADGIPARAKLEELGIGWVHELIAHKRSHT